MKYLFLTYRNEQAWAILSSGERASIEEACLTNNETLRQSSHLRVEAGLPDHPEAIIVQFKDGKLSLIHDSFDDERKEHLVGFFLIEARDLNEAIRLASMMPQARSGFVKVSAVTVFKQTAES